MSSCASTSPLLTRLLLSTLTVRITPDISLETSTCVVGWMVPVCLNFDDQIGASGWRRLIADGRCGATTLEVPHIAGEENGREGCKPNGAA